ncbi:MAG TPA: FMN-dependent NADH-azoreductase [Rhizomicrobium sp.]|jgi:FMN-dependent NADH-azoreductase
MSQLLFVTSSIFGQASKSRQVAAEFVEKWRERHPEANIVERDLGAGSLPHFAGEHMAAIGTKAEDRTEAQQALVSAADHLLEEVEAADTLVIAAPMYNFSIPSTLKAWIDHITRAGRTFQYTAQGPEGLLNNKKVFVIAARGGVYSGESPMRDFDFQEPYLRKIFGFLGMTDVTFIRVEGMQMGSEAASAGVARARAQLQELQPLAANAA